MPSQFDDVLDILSSTKWPKNASRWSDEDNNELLRLVRIHKRDYKEIGKSMGKKPKTVRDKLR